MINYIIQVVLFQTIFLAVYDFFLQKETFFNWNRAYLIVTPLASFLIPFLKFETFQNTVPTEYVQQLPTVLLNPEAVILQTAEIGSSMNYLKILFYAGIAFFFILFLVKLYNILKLITTNEVLKKEQFKLVLLKKTASAFSFFNYIFIKKELIEKKELAIIQHELVHCKQLHTLDLFYFEFLKIIMWFNPLIYVYQNRITLLHEYISDAEVVKETDKNTYFNSILSETFNVENISFINQFFKQSLIKKRIAMITQNKSQKMKQLKYLLLIPLLTGMLLYSSCSNDFKAEIEQVENALKEENIPSEGRYFRAENGFTIFVGTHLAGKVVPEEEYTKTEIEILNKFSGEGKPYVSMSLVIDENGDRVYFLKTKYAPKETVEIEKVDDVSVPFAVIEDAPIYPGCEGTKEELRLCLQESITKHVSENFNAEIAKNLGLSTGTKRIFVMFSIDKNGEITDVQARAPHKQIEEEAIRVIESLPKMIPGKIKGEPVVVKYSLPIAFNVK